MTFRVIKIDNDNDVTEVIATGISTRNEARNTIRAEVRQHINGSYNSERWELRWMPKRGMCRYRKMGTRAVIFWKHEQE